MVFYKAGEFIFYSSNRKVHMSNLDTYLKYFVLISEKHGFNPNTIKLVKYLYLADYYSMKTTGNRLTGWTWKFWDYGPFCVESLDSIKTSASSRNIFATDHFSKFNEDSEYTLFRSGIDKVDQERELLVVEKKIPLKERVYLESCIRRYGNSTTKLLNFVYFKTEPMIKAKPRQNIAFEYVPGFDPFAKVELPPEEKISKEKLRKAKELLAKMKQNYSKDFETKKISNKALYDATYYMGLEELTGESEIPDGVHSGFASIKNYNE